MHAEDTSKRIAAVKRTARDIRDRLMPKGKGYKLEKVYDWQRTSGAFEYKFRAKNEKGEKWIRKFHLTDTGRGYELKGLDPEQHGKLLPYGYKRGMKFTPIVYVVEGENKVKALDKLGVVAITSGGANDSGSVDWAVLPETTEAGARIQYRIWPDNDEPGFKKAVKEGQILRSLGLDVEVINVAAINPALPEGGDCVDYLKQNTHATLDDLVDLPLISLEEFRKLEQATADFIAPPGPGPAAVNGAGPDDWDDPIAFDVSTGPDIAADILPGTFGDYAREIAQATETPEALAVNAIFAAVSTTGAQRLVVSPGASWREPVNLYMVTALPPGNNKSQILRLAFEPMHEWAKAQREEARPRLARLESERKTLERRIEKLRGDAAREDDDIERSKILDKIHEAEATLPKIEYPLQLVVNDATPESLTTKIHEQGGRLAVISDEGGVFETLGGQYSSGSRVNVDILLKGYDGTLYSRIRQNKEQHAEFNPYLTLGIFPQPQILKNISSNGSFTGNGMLERFIYCIPPSRVGYRKLAPPRTAQYQHAAAYAGILKGMLSEFEANKSDAPVVISLDDEALRLWHDYRHQVEERLRPGGDLKAIEGWGSKHPGRVLRVAGLMAMMEGMGIPRTVSGAAMSRAIAYAEPCIEHATIAFHLMGGTQPATQAAIKILEWIARERISTFTKSEMARAVRGLEGKDRKIGIEELLERGYLREELVQGKGRATHRYIVNPRAHSGGGNTPGK